MRRALARATAGGTLDAAEAAVLLQARGDDLKRLLAGASAVRGPGPESPGPPRGAAYSPEGFVPLTQPPPGSPPRSPGPAAPPAPPARAPPSPAGCPRRGSSRT